VVNTTNLTDRLVKFVVNQTMFIQQALVARRVCERNGACIDPYVQQLSQQCKGLIE
jgi:hypothetical protein